MDFHSSGDLADVTALQSELARLNASTMGIMLKIETRSAFELTDEQVVLLADIASTGFSGAESANICIGDTVAVFAQGPIGLCATAGAKLVGASFIIGVEGDPVRIEVSKRMGADVVLDPTECDVIAEINSKPLSGNLEALFDAMKPGDTLKMKVRRGGSAHDLQFRLGSRTEDDYTLIDLLQVTPEQRERRRRWIHSESAGTAAR